jgi:hypothetical protein
MWVFFLFPKLQLSLKGRCFQMIGEIQKNSETNLKAILLIAYQESFQKWQRLWQHWFPKETASKGIILLYNNFQLIKF